MKKFEELLDALEKAVIQFERRVMDIEANQYQAARQNLIRYFAERTATKASAVCGYATTANEAQIPVAHHGGTTGKDGAA